jgi:hypothetical protein
MSLTTELLIAAGIITSMALQLGEHRASARRLLGPLAIVTGFAVFYLKGVPTSGNDGLFVMAGVGLGALLGSLAALLMDVRRNAAGQVVFSAGLAYLALWIVVFGSRLAFAFAATNSPTVMHQIGVFSYQHGITSAAAWTAFFILQAIVMVGVRTVIVGARAYLVVRSIPSMEATAA